MSGESFQVITQSVVTVFITSSANTFGSERRYNKDITIADLKCKLELITGASPGSMKLELYNKDNKVVGLLGNDAALLGSYPVDDGMTIHVIDEAHKLGEFEDTSKVQKFELSADEYAKKTDSVRAFKEKMKLGRFADVDPEEKKRQEEEKVQEEAAQKELCSKMKIGDRCEVQTPGQMSRRGEVKYLGGTEFQSGWWVGVKYDEPVGKNDGSVKGKQYFECPAKYGGFVKPQFVTVGDFPEEDIAISDDEM